VQLKGARLCLDCDEIHEAQQCPVCASETFAYLARWIPSPERRVRPRADPPPEAAVYRRLLVADAIRPKAGRLLKRGAVGFAALSVARWMWRQSRSARHAAKNSD
jgi:hypothetical protein